MAAKLARIDYTMAANLATLTLGAAVKYRVQASRRDGYRYSKCGMVTVDLIQMEDAPLPLFDSIDRERSARLMAALDAVNARFGRGTLVPAAARLKRPWSTKFERRSPCCTTRVAELPRVHA